jgi:glycosyltransferase involved in cell wall biosynthesis
MRRISIIIPTRNRARSLKQLLDSLAVVVTPPLTSVEIVVVNNGSTDETVNLLREEALIARPQELVVLEEQRPGKSNAVNCALCVARGDLLMLLDDDVSVDPQWLVKHIEAYKQTEFAAIQGRILAGKDFEGRPADPSRLREYNIPLSGYGEQVTTIQGLTGTNMSFKRGVFERVGLFDLRLGPGASGFSEDTEFSMRIRKAGFKIGYTPHAIVYHELNPARYGPAYNRDVEFRKGVSRSIYRHDSILFRIVPNLAADCVRYGIYRLLGWNQKVYRTEGRLMKRWGYLTGRFRRWPRANHRSF